MSGATESYFSTEEVGSVTVVRVEAHEIRHPPFAQEFGGQLMGLVERAAEPRILVDLRQTRYLSSTGFAALVSLARAVTTKGGRLGLCNLHQDVQVGASIIGLNRVAAIYDDEASALDSLSA